MSQHDIQKKVKVDNALESLKTITTVVADAGDFESMKKYTPEDDTTNPSLILQASQQPQYKEIIEKAIDFVIENYDELIYKLGKESKQQKHQRKKEFVSDNFDQSIFMKNSSEDYSKEKNPGVESVCAIYKYYKHYNYKTIIMGVSFRSSDQILELAGCDRLRILPKLLEELQNIEGEENQLYFKNNTYKLEKIIADLFLEK